jgi:hypothetical protein
LPRRHMPSLLGRRPNVRSLTGWASAPARRGAAISGAGR